MILPGPRPAHKPYIRFRFKRAPKPNGIPYPRPISTAFPFPLLRCVALAPGRWASAHPPPRHAALQPTLPTCDAPQPTRSAHLAVPRPAIRSRALARRGAQHELRAGADLRGGTHAPHCTHHKTRGGWWRRRMPTCLPSPALLLLLPLLLLLLLDSAPSTAYSFPLQPQSTHSISRRARQGRLKLTTRPI